MKFKRKFDTCDDKDNKLEVLFGYTKSKYYNNDLQTHVAVFSTGFEIYGKIIARKNVVADYLKLYLFLFGHVNAEYVIRLIMSVIFCPVFDSNVMSFVLFQCA